MTKTPFSLLERLRQPDNAAAWERFVGLFTPLLDGWAKRLGVPESDRGDLLQEVFTKLIRTLPQFQYDADRSFRSWLWVILRNTRRDRARGKREVPGGVLDDVPEANEEPDETEYRQSIVARAMKLMQRDFTPDTWQAFWRTAVEGESGSTVAKSLGITVNAVYLARSRVLARLREELAGMIS